jgi:hypothetical protein
MPRTAAVLTAACLAASAGAAPAQDVELSCIDALARKLDVGMGQVEIRSQRDARGGTAVRATVNGAAWTCYVDATGRVTALERGNG